MSDTYKSFPPGSRSQIRVPIGSRIGARAAVALYTPCTPRGVWFQRLAWGAVAIGGGRLIPGPEEPWEPPVEPEAWGELRSGWERVVGPIERLAVFQPRQVDRPRLAMLLVGPEGPAGFVKLRRGDREAMEREAQALEAIASRPARTFRVPRLLGVEGVGDWHSLLIEALPARPHTPVWDPDLAGVLADVRDGLAMLPRPPGTPRHWEPAHGDLAPWNLRRMAGETVLIDWEHAGWAPPGADEVFYRVMSAALRGEDPPSLEHLGEAIGYWGGRSQFQLGPEENLDYEFVVRARHTLRGAAGGPGKD